jgi:hypothetical protein
MDGQNIKVIMMSNIVLWQPENNDVIPVEARSPTEISSYAVQLNPRDKKQIAAALDSGFYEMGMNYLWEKTTHALKKELASVGIGLLGEMLGKTGVDEDDDVNDVLTTRDAIKLAEELGIVNSTDAMRLRHTNELVKHFFNLDDADGQHVAMDEFEALNSLKNCIRGVLGREKIEVAKPFVEFRESLENTTFIKGDPLVDMLNSSPYFFYKLTISVLMNAAKNNTGANLEHSLANINLLIPMMWDSLRHSEKWQVGHTYAEMFSEGKTASVNGIKRALLRVKGFDFVPENLRSDTFVKAADEIIKAHEGTNNFYNEATPVRSLSKLGTSIPTPALSACFSALLSVVLGNRYGTAWNAALVANDLLGKMSPGNWEYYLTHALPSDTRILSKLSEDKPRGNWISHVVQKFEFSELAIKNTQVELLVEASLQGNDAKVLTLAKKIDAEYYGK